MNWAYRTRLPRKSGEPCSQFPAVVSLFVVVIRVKELAPDNDVYAIATTRYLLPCDRWSAAQAIRLVPTDRCLSIVFPLMLELQLGRHTWAALQCTLELPCSGRVVGTDVPRTPTFRR